MSVGAQGRSAFDSQGRPQGVAGASLIPHIGHALRTPLNSILGYTQILELDQAQPLTPVQKERVHQIQTAGWQLLQAIDDAVELARIVVGRLSVSMAPIALEPLLRDSLAQLDQPAVASRVRLDPDAGRDATVWTDPARLKQVMVRLVLGALRCDRGGGSVQIGARAGAEGEATIRIRGDGLALPAGQLETMFLPFDHLAAEDVPGQGVHLGLALAQKLVELMGGRIQVHRDPVSGSELRVLLRGPGSQAGQCGSADAA
jgi:hypothetical protein